MKTTLYLIRHGQTEWNAEHRMQGCSDSPLSPKGIRITKQLRDQLPRFDQHYCSPLGRTRHTATLLFDQQPLQFDDRLKEINLGRWEGRLQAELDLEAPQQHHNFWKAPHLFESPGGENFEEISQRAVACLKDLTERHPGQTIALISHTTILRAMLFSIEPRPLARFWDAPAVYPASVSEVHYSNGVFSITRIGDTRHYLEDEAPNGAY